MLGSQKTATFKLGSRFVAFFLACLKENVVQFSKMKNFQINNRRLEFVVLRPVLAPLEALFLLIPEVFIAAPSRALCQTNSKWASGPFSGN